ncbi:serine/threonine protein kinase [Corallococcus coralloides]|uniref:Serine/threonine protein kinase n=1 Tax=Corallococcus coralloides TaxID=184914 RepID=A0A410RP50_CORCK|nr:serine/threonine-protein kinase [Corallococcus coralloides]QAT83611.1 serine/threonine protein kinase [Corallococcus coralloides]
MASSGGDAPALPPASDPDPTTPGPAPVDAPTEDGERLVPAEAAPASGQGRYALLALLGRGGMGEVHRARDLRLGREVALKFLRGASPERAMRLLQEARAQARLDHPNICRVLDAGELEGRPYIAMQLVEGEPLDRAAATLSVPEKVQVMKVAAEAVHEAHRLGVIHRDLKPSNLLLTRDARGRPVPVVVDFGLAYDTGLGHGLTATGEVMGTPAYMAPEQARGELRAIDRRSDVYGLGATLYELLAGAPPFRGATPLETLQAVLDDEPRPLRAAVPHLDAELETLCLKCLNKDPAQRYASARALAEDLGRYLDGEPILGRRPGPASRLRRLARRHRALVAVSGASLAGMLLLSGFAARSWWARRELQAVSAARERLAEQLGQQVRESEWFVRAYQALPLHDTRPEQARVRERLAAIAALQHGLGARGDGLVQLALGRGLLALREFEPAHRALERARELGVDTPELHSALGQVLGERYRLALEDARRRGGAAWVEHQRRELEARFLAPALRSLEQARGPELESPRYLEGLIAWHRQDLAGAELAAREAVARTPWLPEPRKLLADVTAARALALLERGDYAGARAGFEAAAGRYGEVLEVARSDAASHEALADVWLQVSELDRREGRSRLLALERAEASADKSLLADPDRASGHTRKAQVLMNQYRRVAFQGEADERGAPALLDAWLQAAARAVALAPDDVLAHDSLGYGHFMRGLGQARAGEPPDASFAQAITWLSRAIAMQPRYPWALNDLGLVHRWRGNHQREQGVDPSGAYAEAERCFQRAAEADPAYLFALSNLAELHAEQATWRRSRNEDPGPEVQRARDAAAKALALDGRFAAAHSHLAVAELARASFLVDTGGDARPALASALEHAARAQELNPASDRARLHAASAHVLEARLALREGRTPEPPLARAGQALAEALRRAPACADCRVQGAEVERLRAEHARRQGRDPLPALRRALDEARRATDAHPYAEARLERARACGQLAWALAPRASREVVREGLDQVAAALRLDPGRAEAQAVRGVLLLAGARGREDGAQRDEARAALARAVEQAPWLREEYAAWLPGAAPPPGGS